MQILKGLYQLGGDMNGLSWAGVDAGYEDANSYLLQGSDGAILFDCGCGDTWGQLEERLAYWGISIDSIHACFLTHAHLDHAGGAALVQKMGIPIYAHRETAEAVAAGDERCAGFLYHKEFKVFQVDHVVEDELPVKVVGIDIDVFHLPGHSRGCTAFRFNHEDRKVVVSGDVIGTLLAGDFGWDGSIDFDREAYLQSLIRMSSIDMDIMLPGHGMIYFHEPRRRVESVLNQALMQWRRA
ncbi:MAG: MBL fold metallo-hydrolase [Candidatus Hydrogenedentota bacterium]